MDVELRRVDFRGRSIAYRRAGAGAPLVLVHGFAADSRVWLPQLTGLSDALDVIAWDAPGAGSSADPPVTYRLAEWADDLAASVHALGIERATVVGLSWGGLVAQELYRRHPNRVDRLVLADTYAGWRGSLGTEVADRRLAAALADAALPASVFAARSLPAMFGDRSTPEARKLLFDVLHGVHPAPFQQMARTLAEADTSAALASIRIPTLLIWGEADVRSPVHVGEAFRRAIAGSELRIIPRAGHVTNLEAPDEFNALVRGFVVG